MNDAMRRTGGRPDRGGRVGGEPDGGAYNEYLLLHNEDGHVPAWQSCWSMSGRCGPWLVLVLELLARVGGALWAQRGSLSRD